MKKMYILVAIIFAIGLVVLVSQEITFVPNPEANPDPVWIEEGMEVGTESQNSIEGVEESATTPFLKAVSPTNTEYSNSFLSFQFENNFVVTDKNGLHSFLYDHATPQDMRSVAISMKDGVNLISPDAESFMEGDSTYTSITQGRVLSVRVEIDWNESPLSIEEEIAETQNGLGKYDGTKYEVIKIDGQDAVLASGGSHGFSTISTSVVKDGRFYSFGLKVPNNTKVSEWDFMKAFLETVKFK